MPAATRKAVLDTVQLLLDGLGKHDKAAMLATLVPEGSATLLRDKFVQMRDRPLRHEHHRAGATRRPVVDHEHRG